MWIYILGPRSISKLPIGANHPSDVLRAGQWCTSIGTNRKFWDVYHVLNWRWENTIGPLECAREDLFNRCIVFVCFYFWWSPSLHEFSMRLFPRMLDWIQQIWETLQTRVESVEWSCEVDHIPRFSLTRKRQTASVQPLLQSLGW